MKFLVYALLLLGLALVVSGITAELAVTKTLPERIVYRYLPRTFAEEQSNPVQASEVFEQLFERQSPHPTHGFDERGA